MSNLAYLPLAFMVWRVVRWRYQPAAAARRNRSHGTVVLAQGLLDLWFMHRLATVEKARRDRARASWVETVDGPAPRKAQPRAKYLGAGPGDQVPF